MLVIFNNSYDRTKTGRTDVANEYKIEVDDGKLAIPGDSSSVLLL